MRPQPWTWLAAGLLSVAVARPAEKPPPDASGAPSLQAQHLPPELWQQTATAPNPAPPVDLAHIDKSPYTLFNPTPRQFLREMEALYKSPYTVDAGHAQIETYLVGYACDHDRANGADVRTEIWRIAPTTLKLGLLSRLDVELELAPYTRLRIVDRLAGTTSTRSGFGDLTPKAKLNLWGNDSGPFALALMPFVKLPTNQDGLGNHAVEGGLTLPIGLQLPWGWWLGLSPELSVLRNSNGGGYSPAFANIGYLWHQIGGKLSGYVEFSSWVSFERGSRWVGTADFGLTYLLRANIQLDAGVLVGVTPAAPDLNPFLGVSVRF